MLNICIIQKIRIPYQISILAIAIVSIILMACANNTPNTTANDIDEYAIAASYMADQGFVSLNERILRSTIIARATLRSTSAYAHGTGTPKRYSPMIKFTFDVHEYLKGNGANVIAANIAIACKDYQWETCSNPNKQNAIDHAKIWLSEETNRWWENRQSIIFLQEDNNSNSETASESALPNYKFLPWTDDYATTNQYPYSETDGFSVISERNRVWLPATAATKDASGTTEPHFMLGDKPADLPLQESATGSSTFQTNVSLSDLKNQINATTNLIKQNSNIDEYETCLREKAWRERIPWTPYSLEFPLQSGLNAGTIIDSVTRAAHQHYGTYFFSGPDKNLFEIVLEDNNNTPYDNYDRIVKTTRPLPAGDYSIVYHQMLGILKHCIGSPIDAYTDTPTANWAIHVTAPTGTLHEAFFDPVAIGAAVGADSANGALTPTKFTTSNAVDAEILRVDWTSNIAKIEIANPPASLANHHIDFIALDGSVALRLDYDDATSADAGVIRTFSWNVCNQPWNAGDKLMLRISESPKPIGSRRRHKTNILPQRFSANPYAPTGTLHEAFFDPVAIGAAVGADSANGALTPTKFTTSNAVDAEILRVDWTSNIAKIEIANPPASLANHHIDFIALDGSVALRLDYDDATSADAGVIRTFSWNVCNQPWNAGDKLMLRISESPKPIGSRRRHKTNILPQRFSANPYALAHGDRNYRAGRPTNRDADPHGNAYTHRNSYANRNSHVHAISHINSGQRHRRRDKHAYPHALANRVSHGYRNSH